MSNFVIKKEVIVDTLFDLTKQHQSTIEDCNDRLVKIKDSKKISESNFREISNVIKELEALREFFILRLLNSLKRGDMITG